MTTAEDYINSVLDMMPRSTPMRAQIAVELGAHIAERLADGRSLDDVLRQLGDPVKLADSYLSAETLVAPSFEDRGAAKLVDVLLALVVIAPVAWLISLQVPPEQATRTLEVVTAVCGSVLLGLYTAITEFEYGQTLGKRLFGLRVVSESGRRIGAGQAIVRQVSLIFSYSVDLIFLFFTDKQQRAFEMLSKTRVVQAVPQEVDPDSPVHT